MAKASASVFSISVDNQYGNQHNDGQKLTFIGETGSLQISVISLLSEIKNFQEKKFWLKMFETLCTLVWMYNKKPTRPILYSLKIGPNA